MKPIDNLQSNNLTATKSELPQRTKLLRYLQQLFSKGGPDPEDYPAFTQWLADVAQEISLGNMSAEEVRNHWVQLGDSYIDDASVGNILAKRHGYAGDFEVIDKIYRQHVPANPAFAKWDMYLHAQEDSVAVRNRKEYFIDLAAACASQNAHAACWVLNLGSGPARDILEYIKLHPKHPVHFDCIDHDPKAIAYALKVVSDHLPQIAFHEANVLRYRPKRNYHLIWSAGLFDYLNDRLFVTVLRRYYQFLLPDAEMVIGNFGPNNPTHNCMQIMGEWTLIYRDADHLIALAKEAGINPVQIRVGSEPLGVNLFLHIRKPNNKP